MSVQADCRHHCTIDSCTDKQRSLARVVLLLVLLCEMVSLACAGEASLPERQSFNAGWHFQKGDPSGLADQLDYPKIKAWLLPLANGFARLPSPTPEGALTTMAEYAKPDFDDSGWRKLNLPHDWGIEGPFKQEYPGDTGKLPWWGAAWYRKQFQVPAADKSSRLYLDIDGAMAYATMWVNGSFAGGWPYGYSSFRVDLTPFIRFGESNVVAIRLDNPPESSRWYPGGGIYRNVWLVKTSAVHVAHWGTKITAPEVSPTAATVQIEARVDNDNGAAANVQVQTQLFRLVAKNGVETREPAPSSDVAAVNAEPGKPSIVSQSIKVENPHLWNLEAPNLYVAVTRLTVDGKTVDEYETTFGIRKIEFTADRGFLLNGKRIPLQGVCNHHDLGALGAAFNVRAAQRQLEILKEMGVNALRTTHNPAAPELLDLCDRMGILVIGESFDCWHWGKTENDYARLFNDWSERDLRAMIRRDRNHPSIILWSVGNEIVKVEAPENAEIAKRLVGIVHEEDATRGATAGVNNTPVGFNGYQKTFDVFGFNYRSMFYQKFHEANPQIPVYGSETASTISSRGEYFFPVTEPKNGGMSDFQMSSYDLYAPRWAWPPDAEFKWLDQTLAALGEFVWTGFDYLGEPTPYGDDWSNLLNIQDAAEREKLKKELEAMGKLQAPSRSSYFGIVDLAGFKKDRFYLYQARWRPDLSMAHILPHWNWPGREGQVTPVHVYTSGDEAELFLNGKSLGRKKRGPLEYRLRWDDAKYEPGELKAVAYKEGRAWAEDTVRTAGPAQKIALKADRNALKSDGADLAFVTASLVDEDGHGVPNSDNAVDFEVSGPAEIIGTDNGDATSHVSFQSKQRPAFNGLALAILRTKAGEAGTIRLKASSPGLKGSEVVLESAAVGSETSLSR
jgi:beta-galactosidase